MNSNFSAKSHNNRGRQVKRRKKRNSVLGTVLRCAVLVLISTAIVLFGYIVVHCIKTVYGEKFDLDLYKASQDQTSIIYVNKDEKYGEAFDASNFVEYKRLHGETNRIWVDLESIPKNMQDAIIALEDKRFEEHHGVDWFRTLSVMVVSSNHGQGGSTITQQLVKNLTNKKEVTFVRKFNEILTALNLEKNYEKDEILETYLNTLYLGQGCYGIKTAAELYFGKEVEDLNLAECACLASITQAPGTYDPLINPDNNAKRRSICLNNMLQQGLITQSEYNEAINYEMVYSNSPGFVSQLKDETREEDDEIQSYYVDYIVASLIEDFQEEYDLTYNQAYKKVYYGGLKIYSAENVKAQNIIENVYEKREGFPTVYTSSATKEPIQTSMTIMDYYGRVVAIAGGADKKPGNRCLNRAVDSPRQPGSSIKPLSAYAPAMEKGVITEGSRYIDASGTYRGGSPWPTNYGGKRGTGEYVSIQYAIAQSLNTIPYRIINEMGLAVSYDFLKNTLHFGHLVDGEDDKDYAPMTVGAMNYGVTTLEMTAAFQIFGNGGKYYDPYPYFKVVDSSGSVYFDYSDPSSYDLKVDKNKVNYAISPSCAEIMNRLMQGVINNGTGYGYKIGGYPTFAKTGTTSNNKDRWFVGGTPYFVSAVWYGFDLPAYISTNSSNPAGKIFYNVFTKIHSALELPAKEFDFVENPIAERKEYCIYTGKLAGSNCSASTCLFTSEYDIYCDGNHSTSAANLERYSDKKMTEATKHQEVTSSSQTTTSSGTTEEPTSSAEQPESTTQQAPETTTQQDSGAQGEN